MASSTTVSVGDPLPGEPFGACCHDGDEDRVCVLARDGAGHSVARLLAVAPCGDVAAGATDVDLGPQTDIQCASWNPTGDYLVLGGARAAADGSSATLALHFVLRNGALAFSQPLPPLAEGARFECVRFARPGAVVRSDPSGRRKPRPCRKQ